MRLVSQELWVLTLFTPSSCGIYCLLTDYLTLPAAANEPPSVQTLFPRHTRSNQTSLLPFCPGRLGSSCFSLVGFVVSHPGCLIDSDKSNLLVCRNNQGAEVALPPSLHTHISQMVFHKIRREDLVLVGKPPLRDAFKPQELLRSFASCFLTSLT